MSVDVKVVLLLMVKNAKHKTFVVDSTTADCDSMSCCCKGKTKTKSIESEDESNSPPPGIEFSFEAYHQPLYHQVDAFNYL